MNLTRRAAVTGALAVPAALSLPGLALAKPAPAFAVKDVDGKVRSLAEFKGRVVVLEWVNEGCPYVKKHYSGNMQGLQVSATRDGAVWLTVCSSAPGQQGHWATGAEAKAWMTAKNWAGTAMLIDPDGKMGKAYGAKTTPHMYVIDKTGTLVYQGGIDDVPTNKVEDIKRANNLVAAALADVNAGRPVKVAFSQPYGCAVKYA
ncbi:MAG TPA: redoxin domain-containing protein [Caulobacter sp.]|nr:redoxin domain-containing protein [Caulobacter sp.]